MLFFFVLQHKGHYQQKNKTQTTYNTTNDTLLILLTIQYFLRIQFLHYVLLQFVCLFVCLVFFFFLQLHTYVASELYNAEQVST